MRSLVHRQATVVAAHLRLDRGAATILRDVSLTVGPETRVGVVGPNGVGKTTLLRLLGGLQAPDSGSVTLDPPETTVGYLAQEPELRAGESVGETLLRRSGITAAEAELAAAAAALERGEASSGERYSVALERFTSVAAGDPEARIELVLSELGLDPATAAQRTSDLSGGQQARVALAAILLSRFDITLLDEPTNDLDFAGLDLLEDFVGRTAGGLVVVSHDRSFLDHTVTAVLEIDEHERTGRLYGGGWAGYLEERATSRRHAEEAHASYESQRRELLARASRERSWATSGVKREKSKPRDKDKAQRGFRINRTEQLAARARRTDRAIERLPYVEKPWEAWQLRFAIDEAPRAGAIVARLEGAVVERGSFRLGPLDLVIGWADRVALTGSNGAGKTTLVEAMLGRVPLSEGKRTLGPSVVVGEVRQDRRPAARGRSALDELLARTGLALSEARSLLAKFGLGAEHVRRPRSSLSPGERTRADLATFQAVGVNFLVLDEPTNHLDLPAIEQLEEALAAYTGTLLLVSHDRRLLESVEITSSVTL